MNRRGFLTGLLGAAAGAAIAPAILVPERTIFLPPAGGWPRYSNGLMTASDFSRELMAGLNEVFKQEYAARLTDPDAWFIKTEPDPPLRRYMRMSAPRRSGMSYFETRIHEADLLPVPREAIKWS